MKFRNLLSRILAGLLALLNLVPSITVISNPWLFVMILPFGAFFILTFPWPVLKYMPDPFHPGESLYWLTYTFLLPMDSVLLPSPSRWGVLDASLLIVGLATFIVAFATWLKNSEKGLLTRGIYGVVRHPQYLGIILLSLGISIRSLRPASFIAWLTLLYGYLVLASLEERSLLKAYEREYEEYRTRTPFMVPFLRLRAPEFLSPQRPYRYLLLTILYLASIAAVLILARGMVATLKTFTT